MSDIIRPGVATKLDQNFRQFMAIRPELYELFLRLPQRVLYYPIISACYNRQENIFFKRIINSFRIFYGRHKRPANCPGPLRCDLPPLSGIRCAIGTRQTRHAAIHKNLVHFEKYYLKKLNVI